MLRDLTSNCNIHNTGNILNSIIPVLYQSIVPGIVLCYSTTYTTTPKVSTPVSPHSSQRAPRARRRAPRAPCPRGTKLPETPHHCRKPNSPVRTAPNHPRGSSRDLLNLTANDPPRPS